jgi:NitT/TauT family transport system substrate-binding protein
MKKLFSIIMCLLMCLSTTFLFACKPDDNVIRLSEVTHSTFYAPLYVAINNGYFEEEGLKLQLSSGEGADKVMASITSKSVDIGFCGPEAVIYCKVNGQKDHPIVFAQLTKRDGSFLVSKTDIKDFKWSDLKGKRLLAGRKGGVPAMTLQYVLNQNGVSLDELNFDTSVAFANMAGVFQADTTVDFTTLFEPTASEVVANGKGYIIASVGLESGEIPYTAFTASKSFIKNNPDKIKKFIRAIVKGYKFTVENDAETVARALAPSFDGISIEALTTTVESYVLADAWSSTPVMNEQSFNRLQDVMQNAGELKNRVNFADVVDNTYASEVIAEFI